MTWAPLSLLLAMETFLLKVRRRARSHIEDDESLVSHFADRIARTFTANAVPRPFLVLADRRGERPSRPVIRPFSHPSPNPGRRRLVLQYEILFDNAASGDHFRPPAHSAAYTSRCQLVPPRQTEPERAGAQATRSLSHLQVSNQGKNYD